MNWGLSIIGILLVLTTSCGKDVADSSPGTTSNPVQIPREERSFPKRPGKVSLWDRQTGYDCAVFLPKSYLEGGTKTYPLVLSLHGYNGTVLNSDHTAVGGNRQGFIKQVWNTDLSDTFEAIVIAPHVYPVGSSENRLWNRDELRDLIVEATMAFRVDPDRIVATGLSSGSIATQELLRYSKDLLAGGMPGAFQYLYGRLPCEFAAAPVWAFGNNSDNLFDAGSWLRLQDEIESCPDFKHKFRLDVNRNTCGHGCWDIHWSKPEVQRWLIQQVR